MRYFPDKWISRHRSQQWQWNIFIPCFTNCNWNLQDWQSALYFKIAPIGIIWLCWHPEEIKRSSLILRGAEWGHTRIDRVSQFRKYGERIITNAESAGPE